MLTKDQVSVSHDNNEYHGQILGQYNQIYVYKFSLDFDVDVWSNDQLSTFHIIID